MAHRGAALVLLASLLSGCVTYPDITQSRSPCRMEPGGWCDFVRDAAAEAYPYVLASTEAYQGDDDTYGDLSPVLDRLERLPIDEDDADKGFDYQIFEHYASAGDLRELKARVVAFRGTDFDSATDIWFGTVRDDQIDIALRYFAAEKERWGDDVPWIVTGHSLGGALATEVSIMHPGVKAYMFNVSPFYRGDSMANDTYRTVINERGEALRQFRKYYASPAADTFVVNCRPEASSLTKHKIRRLSDCITWIAAYNDPHAHAFVQRYEIRKPPVECGPSDKVHPGVGVPVSKPCVHVARRDEKKSNDAPE
ncbi:MAG: hypothetical protein KJP27_03640 [Altererythrobacter sp.]|nr:hypothetical protein [Altererythrobacter sp.]